MIFKELSKMIFKELSNRFPLAQQARRQDGIIKK